MAALDPIIEPVRWALGLRSTAQSIAIIGGALGIFAAHGLDLRIVAAETTGPAGLKALLAGELDFLEVGAVPIVQAVLEGKDARIVAAAEPIAALYLLGRGDVTSHAALAGGRIGVLSAGGQTGISARRMLDRWQVADASLEPLGTYPAIFDALAGGRIAAGVLTADYRIVGARRHHFTTLADLGAAFAYQGPVIATTQRLVDAHPARVQAVADAYCASVRRFKTDAAAIVPCLRDHLGFVDLDDAHAIHAFYAERFSDIPIAGDEGIRRALDDFRDAYPHAASTPVDTINLKQFVLGAKRWT